MHKCANISNAIKHIADAHKKNQPKMCLFTFIIWYLHSLDSIHHACLNKRQYSHIHMYRNAWYCNVLGSVWMCATTAQFTYDSFFCNDFFWHVYIRICFCFRFHIRKQKQRPQITIWLNEWLFYEMSKWNRATIETEAERQRERQKSMFRNIQCKCNVSRRRRCERQQMR